MSSNIDIINYAQKLGFRKNSIIDLLTYYNNLGYSLDDIQKTINNYNLDILFLNMDYYNPYVNNKKYEYNKNSYDNDLLLIKLLNILDEPNNKCLRHINKKKRIYE
jgi:hypothetical protein